MLSVEPPAPWLQLTWYLARRTTMSEEAAQSGLTRFEADNSHPPYTGLN